jgi:uncharacterized integral membrane protein
LYILDSSILLFAIIYTIRLIILAHRNQGEADFAFLFYTVMGVLIFFSLMSLFLTYCDTKS